MIILHFPENPEYYEISLLAFSMTIGIGDVNAIICMHSKKESRRAHISQKHIPFERFYFLKMVVTISSIYNITLSLPYQKVEFITAPY